jgi:hypothetical protein
MVMAVRLRCIILDSRRLGYIVARSRRVIATSWDGKVGMTAYNQRDKPGGNSFPIRLSGGIVELRR